MNGPTVSNGTINGHTNGHITNGTNGTSVYTNGHTKAPGHFDRVGNGVTSNGCEGSQTKSFCPEPIAICGMSVRLPGGLHSPQQLWDFLISKGDARGPVPESRYKVSSFYSETTKPGTVKTEYGYFLDETIDIATVDTSFFTMRRAEVERADPQQRQMLEVARECMEDAGEMNWKGRPIGCYMGSFGEDWTEMFAKENQQYGLYRVTGYGDFMLPNRVSYELDLMGPSMVIRTGCSAALVALHEACLAINRGDCEAAIVGGANLIMAPGMTTAMTEQGVLAPDGSCKTFSADANGYARGEAVTAIFIKPLADAIRDGNPVRAVIRATASNSDGKGTAGGIQVPNDIAQEAMIRRAYELAGIQDYSETAFVECHGTGTPIGDPIEVRAVGRVFGPAGGVQIGSVKPNLGHSEGASGLTSLIKSVLALENRTIPPNIKFNEPNPDIPWEACGLSVPVEPMPWPVTRRERVSVNSFGIGGTNAHLWAISCPHTVYNISPNTSFSANHADSLEKMIENYEGYVEKNPDRVTDLAFTLGTRREHLPYRSFAVASPLGSITKSSASKAGEAPDIAMVFTGQGAQWPQMGRRLLRSPEFPIFERTIKKLDQHLRTLENGPDWSIQEELQKPTKTSRLSQAELSQPLCTAVQVALVDLLESIGVAPTAVVGHSSGEVAAAYAAGALTANEAITVAYYRGQVAKLQTKPGAMAAIGMGSEEVQRYLQPGVIVACENSPKSITLAGDREAVEGSVAAIKESQPDLLARLLQVDKAYHSHHMAEVGDSYHAMIGEQVSPKSPTKLFFSSVEEKLLTQASDFGPKYWQKNLESPVRFNSAITTILQHKIAKNLVFLEVGPHSALAGPLRQIQTKLSNSSPYASALIRNQNDVESFLTAIGKLYTLNIPIDFTKVITRGSILPDLPRYPWNHSERFWYESRLSKEWRNRQHKYHDLLGVRVPESLEFNILFRNLFHLENAPWIRDHKVGEDIVFPFAGYAGMIGEAVRQITGVEDAYKLRNIVVSTALVLNEGQPVEIMTTFRRLRLTDSLDSEWWEFTIASYNGTVWTKHCSGQARSHSEDFGTAEVKAPLLRKVGTRRCYESMSKSGLNFGPTFQRLESVRSDTVQRNATAEVTAKEGEGNGYHLHPTVIDASLQLLSVAASKGYADPTTKMMVPTNIEEMSIYRHSENVQVRASADYTPNGSITGSGQCVASDGRLILRSTGIRLSVVDDQTSDDGGEPTARAEWGPHIDFLDANTLIKPSVDRSAHMPILTELSNLCMFHTKRVIAELETTIRHMQNYRSWIDRQLQSVDTRGLERLDNNAIEQRVTAIVEQLSQTSAVDAAVAINKIFRNVELIFTGKLEALDLLLSDDTLSKLYIFMDQCDESQFFKHLAHSKPNLRVLEIGAGTGGSTENILKLLTPGDKALYSKYMFTDISSGFFVAAKERFRNYSNMEYATLDISKSLAEQGFEEQKYDLILATNVIHATKSLRESLSNVRELLDPNGRLLLHELSSTSKWVNYVWGTLAGWWYGAADGRADEPYISVERWARELETAGFRTPDAAVLDSPEPHQLNAMIVARPALARVSKKEVTILTLPESENGTQISRCLQSRGFTVQSSLLSDAPLPAGRDIIALLDDEGPFFENIGEHRLEAFKKLISTLKDSGIFWITGLSQMNCQDPRFGQVQGIARTIRSEMLVDFATCEVDHVGSSMERIVDVFEKFQLREEDETLKPEFEFAIVENSVHVGRIHPFSVQSELQESKSDGSIALRTSKPGRLTALHWARQEIGVLKGDEVEVEAYATGLNFKDVLCAMGIVEASENGFGLEAGGIVRRIGPHVKDLKVGDRVMLIAHCAFATEIVVSENLCEKIPDGLGFEDAATMPCVFATSIYSIFNIGNLQKGQSILIHSACGGVGLATIQLAQMIGAEIYATVGNDEKVKYLMDTFGLPRNRIFNSRNASFADDVMRETNGEGVDLALNSLSGELLHATWKCIAVFGKMVEIGKRDLIGSGKLDMSTFEDNRSYCCVDLDQICFRKPKNIVNLVRERHINPIQPIKVFSSDAILDAFRYMQQGVHLGKIVVAMRKSTGKTSMLAEVKEKPKAVRFDHTSAYLLVGGLGGLGRSISTWMVERGARHLIYFSRSAGTKIEHQEFAQELASMGCRADFIQGDVTNLDDVTRAVAQARGHLKGILQMSMVLSDQNFTRMTLKEWNTAVNPKTKGTWNLHNASLLAAADLDFFVFFSSLSGIIGQPGQANYAGANTFLDAFSQYRHNLGLPACSIEIGAVEEVGYMAEHDTLMQKLKGSGASDGTVSERELLEAMAAAMTSMSKPPREKLANISSNNFSLGFRSNIPLSSPSNRSLWKKDVRLAVFHNIGEASGTAAAGSNDTLKSFISSAKGDAALLNSPESAHLLAIEIGKKVFGFLLKPEEDLKTSCSLSELGMDSLVAIEMRQWWKTIFGFDISVLEMMGMGTLDALGEHAAKGMLKIFHGSDEE
ncbi:polyketide synthase [Penicillium macrosclerotiorum]|uniref:polyketide synthase n=1 Tax=Penicillium macrosclerotiorum TaxID=303699 RepID=UPI002547F1DF|nr:polyketide synthase [Penicillium macrosclerotiorum]KAJ5675621.1 polyketide synthase [Penicillium macrosclerotiorum]